MLLTDVIVFNVFWLSSLLTCLLTLPIVNPFPSSCRMIGFDNAILQLRSYFKLFDFSTSKSSTIFLDVLVVASLVPACKIK